MIQRKPLKCQSQQISDHRHRPELSLEIDSRVVKSSDKLIILGVNIDDKLTFSEHIKDISKRANKKVGVLLRLRNLIPCSAKLQLYKFGILPYMTYCDVVWHFCKPPDKRKLERVQEGALREVFKSKSESYGERLESACLPTLYEERLRNIAT